MTGLGTLFVSIGAIFLASLAIDYLGRRTWLPRVTLLLLFGLLIGPSGLNLLTADSQQWFPLMTDIALLMVGFLIGGNLSKRNFEQYGRLVLSVSLFESTLTALLVLIGLLFMDVDLAVALMLAGIATATAPAATVAVVDEIKARGVFTQTLLGIVAIDDVWGLVVFSVFLSAAAVYVGDGASAAPILMGLWDVFGAILVGMLLGVPAAYLTGRVRTGEPTLIEAIGVIFLCGGVAIFLEVSILLAVVAMGATIINLASHHNRPFHAIEHIEWPFMILFFVLAGASLHADALLHIGLLGMAYILLRAAGKILGAWVGATISRAPAPVRTWTGIALMPQAGVAMGMALVASQRFPESAETILTVVIGAIVVFELLGPILTRIALTRSGDVTE